MGRKKDPYMKHADKLMGLFVRLFYANDSRSLTELAHSLNCSKSTVLRLIDDVEKTYGVNIEEDFRGNRKYVKLKKATVSVPLSPVTEAEWHVLQMCRSFSEHLLGRKLFEEATQALLKGKTVLGYGGESSLRHFACFRPGTIDYTPHHETIHTLITAMEKKKVCKVTYKALMQTRAKTFYVKPIRMFSHKDTVYLHAQMARTPGKKYREPDFDPLLVVHRFVKVELTDTNFTPPETYDFEKMYNREFGIMKDDEFEVTVEFSGWAAQFVSERVWSSDQKIKKMGKGSIQLTFTAASEAELISWVLSFGDEARVLEPGWLVDRMKKKADKIKKHYFKDKISIDPNFYPVTLP